ncbi:HRDC domain-containing protein [Polyangium sp. y55x31]|uniref:HRDC domain-containing protein n=1 Tax=Polyangium sp. y55x31 TaxID=3042688 RepID=UPI0024824365|nr:HRDC domain-containing protein [Polyangium sp. y55x31]MDI1482149.1 HRDC domain-containing protein [Polyangium sp. y55x31]
MTSPEAPPYEVLWVDEARALGGAIERAMQAEAIAVDVEANGLFVYRPRLCAAQLAWEEGDTTVVLIVDTLATNAAALEKLLGPEGPIKVLHDLTFDARMLAEAGAPLARVRDTSVTARFLGQKATGLASVLAAELGVVLDKRFQQHDWSKRPVSPAELRYLGDDVAYLLKLDRALAAKAAALDIEAEIEEECAYKLRAAMAPPRETRPSYVRIKGAHKLDRPGRAALRSLVAAREAIAEAADVPPFKIVTNEILIELAQRRPTSISEVGRVPGALSGRSGRHAARWLEAIARGAAEGDVPPEEQALFEVVPIDRKEITRRREIEAKISGFRRAEAKRRGVDEQAVLPGHCAQDLASILLTAAGETPAATLARIAAIPGLGEKRVERYGKRMASLLSAPGEASAQARGSAPHEEP